MSALILWPPSDGPLLIIPITTSAASAIAREAVAGGASLLAMGPLPGSLIVIGNRARLSAQLSGWQTLIVAAPPAGCRPSRPPED